MEDDCNCCCLRKANNHWSKQKSWQAAADCGCLGGPTCGCGACQNVDPDDIGILSLMCRLICCYSPIRLFTCLFACIPDGCWFLWNGCKLCCTHVSMVVSKEPGSRIKCCHLCDEENISNYMESRESGISPSDAYQSLIPSSSDHYDDFSGINT